MDIKLEHIKYTEIKKRLRKFTEDKDNLYDEILSSLLRKHNVFKSYPIKYTNKTS